MPGVEFRYKKFSTESEARKFIADNLSVPGASNDGPSISKIAVTQASRPIKRPIAEKEQEVQQKRAKFSEDFDESVTVVYTDGACSNNGRSNAKAGWGVYWGDGHKDNAYGPVYGEPTNNRGELIAVQRALETAISRRLDKILIKTDSNLLIQSLDKWIGNWRRKGWKTASGDPVKNRDLLEKIDSLRNSLQVKFEHVRGHQGIYGNEKADEFARLGAQLYQ